MVAPRSILNSASALAIVWQLGPGVPHALADSILAGKVIDVITQQPIAGAEISIEYAGQVIGSGSTDINGLYSVPFVMPASASAIATMIASARSNAHELNKSNFQVDGGTPVAASHDIALYPAGVTACRSQTGHSVIVGHFLPPVGSNFADLPARVAQSLDFTLNTKLQSVSLPPDLQPSFEPCEAAKPKTARFGANYAKALQADAFVGGNIAADGPSEFSVSTYVSDAHSLFTTPKIATSKSVNLDNPSGANMAADIHVAVLASIAAGLAQKDDCVSAVTVLSVAEQLLDPPPPYLVDLRQRCEAKLPNIGLLGSSP
jgi:hypothetical protein